MLLFEIEAAKSLSKGISCLVPKVKRRGLKLTIKIRAKHTAFSAVPVKI